MTWLAVVVLTLAVAGLALYKAWPVLFPRIGERAPLNTACDVSAAACVATFAGSGTVELDIQPRGIPVVHPLEIEVRLSNLPPPARVELDFAGVDMDMGYNRVQLHPVPDRPGVYSGRGMLPVCVRERMTWEARVLLYRDDSTLAAPFRFETTRRG